MKLYCTFFFLLIITGTGFSQTFKADKNGYVSDPEFLNLIKQRNYQLVSAFDTVQMDSSKKILATVVRENKIYNLDLKGNELAYYDELQHQITRNENSRSNANSALKKKYNDIRIKFDEKYQQIEKDGMYGLAFKQGGKVFLEPKYKGVWPYVGVGLISVRDNQTKLEGIMDSLGKVVVKPEYDNILICVIDTLNTQLFVGYKNGLTTLINGNGKELFPPRYTEISPYSEIGLLVTNMRNAQQEKLYGLIDKNGKVIAEPKYSELTNIPNSSLIRTFIYVTGQYKYGLISRSGKVILEVSNDFVNISGDEKLIMIQKDRKTGYVDRTGNLVVPIIYNKVISADHSRLMIVGLEYEKGILAGKTRYGMVNLAQKQIIPIIYDELFEAGNFFYGLKDKVYCKISKEGKIIKTYDYLSMKTIANDFLMVKDKTGQIGLIDSKEKIMIPFEYKEMENAMGLYFFTSKGIIDMDNHLVAARTWEKTTWTNELALRKRGLFFVNSNQFPRSVLGIDRYSHVYNTKTLKR